MLRKAGICAVLLGVACMATTGCAPQKKTIEEMKAQMPQRPVELDRLDQFVGKWRADGEGKFAMLDEPLKISGTSEAAWEGDRWYVVVRGVMNMEHFGDSQGHETWTYDTHDKVYRSTWVDSMGMSGMGVSKYDEKSDTWRMTATSHGPWGKSTIKGSLRFPNADTMEWEWTERSGLMKVMEMKGTSSRVE